MTRGTILSLLSVSLLLVSPLARAVPSLTIQSGEWHLLSYPANTSGRTVRSLFSGSLRAADYGTLWQVFTYNGLRQVYENPGIDGGIDPGAGFWIIQATGRGVELGQASVPFATGDTAARACESEHGCATVPLDSRDGVGGWNMAGHPFEASVTANDIRVFTRALGSSCRGAGCAYADADAVVGDILWAFDPTSERYRDVSRSTIDPWDGFWIPVQQNALESRAELVFPDPFCS